MNVRRKHQSSGGGLERLRYELTDEMREGEGWPKEGSQNQRLQKDGGTSSENQKWSKEGPERI
jgi:hypothetical protein